MVAAVAAALTGVVILATAAIGLLQLNEARRIRKAQLRPFVVVEWDVNVVPPMIYLKISNIGATGARDVRFTFEPALASSFDKDGWGVTELQLFKDGISLLPPERVISFLFDSWLERGDLPDKYRVHLVYRGDPSGRYTDEIDLDLGLYRNMRRISRKGLHEVQAEVERLRKAVEAFAASGGGLLAVSVADQQQRGDEVQARVEEWARSRREQQQEEPETPPQESPPSQQP